MAFLLLLHEKMKLKRQVNKLTLKQAKYGNRLERMTKNISRVQKMYESRLSKAQKQAQLMQSHATTAFQNMMGLGTMNQAFSPGNYGSMTSFVLSQTIGALSNGFKLPDGCATDGKLQYKNVDIDSTTAQSMMQEYMAGTLKAQYKKDENGNIDTTQIEGYGDGKYSDEQYKAFMSALTQAQQNQSQAQVYCQQMNTQYQNNISIWLEAQEAQIEAEQDEVLLPLQQEQTEMELDNDSVQAQLEYAKTRLEAIDQACSEEIKNSAPKFGLA